MPSASTPPDSRRQCAGPRVERPESWDVAVMSPIASSMETRKINANGGKYFQSKSKPCGNGLGTVIQPPVPGSGACSPPASPHTTQPAITPKAAPAILAHARPVACAATITAMTTTPTSSPSQAGAPARTGVASP